jgi:hypothetical protein
VARSPIDVSAFLNVGLRGWARRLRTRPAKERIGRAASRGDDSAIVGNEERPPHRVGRFDRFDRPKRPMRPRLLVQATVWGPVMTTTPAGVAYAPGLSPRLHAQSDSKRVDVKARICGMGHSAVTSVDAFLRRPDSEMTPGYAYALVVHRRDRT